LQRPKKCTLRALIRIMPRLRLVASIAIGRRSKKNKSGVKLI
jgi:hypothetical protein